MTVEMISLDDYPDRRELVSKLIEASPALIHLQHEYGIFGGKNPPKYWFPAVLSDLSVRAPQIKRIATAHTVLPVDYKFPTTGRGLQAPLRAAANVFLLPLLRRTWIQDTWGALDGVITHSDLQRLRLQDSIRKQELRFAVIPHFVPQVSNKRNETRRSHPSISALPANLRKVVVFGFFTPEKGQDVAIAALRNLPGDVHLVLAGGARRFQDEAFLEKCRTLVSELGLDKRVTFTGFVEPSFVSGIYQDCDLVLAPFRETSGSGSLAQAFARGAPVLASDLPLNREINDRTPGALAFFKSEDPQDCAKQILGLLEDRHRLETLRAGARKYAEACTPERIAREHVVFYSKLLY